jgi:hypothetical protein
VRWFLRFARKRLLRCLNEQSTWQGLSLSTRHWTHARAGCAGQWKERRGLPSGLPAHHDAHFERKAARKSVLIRRTHGSMEKVFCLENPEKDFTENLLFK